MARFNEILVGRYNRFLQKLLSMKGGPVAAQLASEIQPTIQFSYGPSMRYLEGWQTFATFDQVAGVGGDFTAARLRNPQQSNVAAEIIKVFLNANQATPFFIDVRMGLAAADLTTVLGGAPGLDPRAGITQFGPNQYVNNSACVRSVVNQVADPSGTLNRIWEWQMNNAANDYNKDMVTKEGESLPLMPGMAIQVQTPTASGGPIQVAWWWRERFLEDSERF